MRVRVRDLRLPVGGDERELVPQAIARAGLRASDVAATRVLRKSLDRRRGRNQLVFTLELDLREGGGPAAGRRNDPRVRFLEPPPPPEEPVGDVPLDHRPVVVGSGPGGLFAALHLARRGYAPLLLERGDPMNLRVRAVRDLNRSGVLDEESNYLFGEGGAGTFSDGKLTSRSKDPRAGAVLEEFRRKSGIDDVAYHYRPHLGSERIRAVVGRLRREILDLGGEIRFRCRVEGLVLREGAVRGLRTSRGEVPAEQVVLAPGHSARDLYEALLRQGVAMEAKPFQLGLRVEHPQDVVDRAVWGPDRGVAGAGPADYRLSVRSGGTTVYSFCMCPGGEIMPAISDLRHMNTNGMSHSGRSTGFANSGLVTTLEPAVFPPGPLGGVGLQRRHESRAADIAGRTARVPAQRLLDYLADRPSEDLPPSSCLTGHVPASLSEVLPPAVDRLLRASLPRLERQLAGFLHERALLVGPESRSSSPVRLLRDPRTLQGLRTAGLYPVGEGAGYAGGIVSAAADGLRAAQALQAAFRPAPA